MDEISINDEFYTKFDNYEDFDKWCSEGYWNGAEGFKKSTGVDYHEIEGLYFQVVHNRIYIKGER